MNQTSEKRKTPHLIGLLLLVPIPSLFVYMYNTVLAGNPMGAQLWMGGKIWIVIWPCLWYLIFNRTWPRPTWSTKGLKHGAILGLIMTAVMLLIFFLIDDFMPHEALKKQAADMKMDRLPNFLAMYTYIAVVNALIEEYVWRWFVTRRWEAVLGVNSEKESNQHPLRQPAILLSGATFTLHHAVFLMIYVPAWINAICCLGVFTGGVIWSWLLVKYKSVWPAYVCHFFADLAIFFYAWYLLF